MIFRLTFLAIFIGVSFLPKHISIIISLFVLSLFLSLKLLKKIQINSEIFVIYAILYVSYFLFPPLIILILALFLLVLTPPTDHDTPPPFITPQPRFLELKNLFLLFIFYMISYLSAMIVFKTLFHVNRLYFSFWYGTTAFLLYWIHSNHYQSLKISFPLFFAPIFLVFSYLISLFDLKFHPALSLDLIIKGFFITALFSLLIYLLDMIPKKIIAFAVIFQYLIIIFFGTKAYTLFMVFFFFQTTLHIVTNSQQEKTYAYIESRLAQSHFLYPTILFIFLLFVSNKNFSKAWPLMIMVFMFPLFITYSSKLWHHILLPLLRKFHPYLQLTLKIVGFNLLFLLFLSILSFFSVFNMRTLIPIIISMNLTMTIYLLLSNHRINKWKILSFSSIVENIFFSTISLVILIFFRQVFSLII